LATAADAEVPFRQALADLGTLSSDELSTEEDLNAAVERGVAYQPALSALEWVVPSDRLPVAATPLASNNNVALGFHRGRLYLAWRSGPFHFASPEARMYVVSSADWGAHWEHETTVDLRSDVREPMFSSVHGRLIFSCFQAGTNRFAFE